MLVMQSRCGGRCRTTKETSSQKQARIGEGPTFGSTRSSIVQRRSNYSTYRTAAAVDAGHHQGHSVLLTLIHRTVPELRGRGKPFFRNQLRLKHSLREQNARGREAR